MEQRAAVYELFDDKKYQEVDAVMTSGMPLAMASTGERVRIVSLIGGRGISQRLTSMGLSVGSEIEVLKKGFSGPLLVSVGDTRLGVGAGIAHKIMVSPV